MADVIPGLINTTLLAMCKNISSTLVLNKCSSLISETAYKNCLQIVSKSTSTMAMVMGVAYVAAVSCKEELGLTVNPADNLCNRFGVSYPNIGGENCDVVCKFGQVVKGTCLCNAGYWGKTCDQECPGGHTAPCGNHGRCNQTSGVCLCDQEWNGDSKCSSCTKFFTGENCDLFNSDPEVGVVTSPATVGNYSKQCYHIIIRQWNNAIFRFRIWNNKLTQWNHRW
ncbi:hypothetical protein DPMN_003896 [Dreissena polymorpha]|uniref:EGF-like domain-containing protein n=1 Tax=Dreissena polymorpha TaxID=45954 RepID=A0A9D4MQK0_DREPO|nr:hypothetical protein DPMN_003896 [Dreissena polymorpha]